MIRLFLLCALTALCLSLASAVPFSGQVVAPDGKPVEGARVCIYAGEQPPEATTDAGGLFSLPLPDAFDGKGGAIVAYAPGYAMQMVFFEVGKPCVITLQPAATVSGHFVDTAGKPLAGVEVVAVNIMIDEGRRSYGIPIPFQWRDIITAKSDENGDWTIANLPIQARVGFQVTDPRYARMTDFQQISNAKTTLPAYTLQPGAVLTGMVLTPDGKPAEGAFVNAVTTLNVGFGSGATDADGKFHLEGLAADATYTIYIGDPRNRGIARPMRGIVPKANVDIAVNAVQLELGGLLEGTITDLKTGEPVTASLAVLLPPERQTSMNGNLWINSQGEGKFSTRVYPGPVTLRMEYHPNGYKKCPDMRVEIKEGETTTVAIKLDKGLTLEGIIRDVDGNPLPGVSASLELPRISQGFSTDDQGKFSISGLEAGTVSFGGNLWRGFPEWEFVANTASVTLPIDAPIELTMQRVSTQTLTGRVVTSQGTPLPEVKINLSMMVQVNNSGHSVEKTVTTDANGIYSLPGFTPANVERISINTGELPGYKMVSPGVAKKADGQFTISDIVFADCSGVVSGKVLDVQQQPVAGAVVVCLDGGLQARTTSAADGSFILTGLPVGEIHLFAVNTANAGFCASKTGENAAEIRVTPTEPPAPRDVERVAELLKTEAQLPVEQQRFDPRVYLPKLARLDYDQAMSLAETLYGELPDALRSGLVIALAETDPARAAKEGIAQLDLIYDEQERFKAAIALGLAVAKQDVTLAEHCYSVAESIPPAYNDTGTQRQRQMVLLSLALACKLPDAAIMFAEVIKPIKGSNGNDYFLRPLVDGVANSNPELLAQIWPLVDETWERRSLMERGITILAQTDIKAAQALFSEMAGLFEQYQSPQPQPVSSIVRSLGKTDPAAALAFAQSLDPRFWKDRALITAAAYQPREVALKLYQDFADENTTINNRYQAIQIAEAAVQAYQQDQDTGRKLLAPALAYMMAGKQSNSEQDEQREAEMMRFAFAAGDMDPVESRILLEVAYIEAKKKYSQQDTWRLFDFPAVMAHFDWARAREMQQELAPIWEKDWSRTEAKMIEFLLGDNQERMRLLEN